MNYEDAIVADARLCILRELSRQTDNRLNDSVLATVLEAFGMKRSRDWVRTQLRGLAELGAITVTEIGQIKPVLVAELTELGLDHVERRRVIEGVKRPAPGV